MGDSIFRLEKGRSTLEAASNADHTLLAARVPAPSLMCWDGRDAADTARFRSELMTRPRENDNLTVVVLGITTQN
jgi:hypothetical protein